LWWRFHYISITKVVPKEGGTIKEVIVGEPQSFNPIFAPLNDADKDISELIYGSLLKYNEQGEIEPDLAKEYKVSSNGKIYTFTLRKKLLWSDGQKITADDIIFTMDTIQSPEVQSPLRVTFQGVKVTKVDERHVKFKLDNPYPSFIENLNFKIIPKHIFQEINPQELSSFIPENPANSGPFKLVEVGKEEERIKNITLEKNENYYKGPPYLQKFEITFVDTKEEALDLASKMTNLGDVSAKDEETLGEAFDIYPLHSPRYFALFLNQQKSPLTEEKVREAMALATPKSKIIEKVFNKQARGVNSPFLPENRVKGKYKVYRFNLKQAKNKLKKDGWVYKKKGGVREKEIDGKDVSLKFTIYTVDQKDLLAVANIIKDNWSKVGIKVEIKKYEPQELLQSIIKERKYDILLFGHSLMMIPEPYSFWHSSQIEYPGLNLSLYENEEVDDLLDKAREETDIKTRRKILRQVQKKVTEDIPAIFLYSPNYLYAIRTHIKGFNGKYIIDPSKRFIGIEGWYIYEKRVSKDAQQNNK
jgi:peptide/nickel transport system substrate-binding protein